MAQAIVFPLLKQKLFSPKEIFAVVGQQTSIESLIDKVPKDMQVVSSIDAKSSEAWDAPIQLLAVKPQQFDLVAKQASRCLSINQKNKPILVSLLAGITLERLQKAFPQHHCVRTVPNTPSLVGAGLTGITWGKNFSTEQRLAVRNLFEPVSEVFELKEDYLDAFLALTSSGPAYVAVIVEALADGAVAAGLPRKMALDLANRTLSGTALLLKEKGLHPGELKDMVASPGGTTITALRHLEKAGVRSSLIEAVVAAANHSKKLG